MLDNGNCMPYGINPLVTETFTVEIFVRRWRRGQHLQCQSIELSRQEPENQREKDTVA